WLFFFLPSRKAQREAAEKVLESFFSDGMRQARVAGWTHLVAEVSDKSKEAEGRQRRRDFLAYVRKDYAAYSLTPQGGTSIQPQMHGLYREVSHVLDFFAVVEGLLEDAAVDEKMLRQGLVFYYHWWRDEVMDPLRNLFREIQKPTADPKCVPPWAKPMRQLD